MKYVITLVSLMLAATAAPAFAHEGNDCATQAEKIANMAEREAFTKSCLEKAAAPAKSKAIGQKEKEANCNQNAKNMKLEGHKKSEYLEHCYRENDFDPSAPPHPKM